MSLEAWAQICCQNTLKYLFCFGLRFQETHFWEAHQSFISNRLPKGAEDLQLDWKLLRLRKLTWQVMELQSPQTWDHFRQSWYLQWTACDCPEPPLSWEEAKFSKVIYVHFSNHTSFCVSHPCRGMK